MRINGGMAFNDLVELLQRLNGFVIREPVEKPFVRVTPDGGQKLVVPPSTPIVGGVKWNGLIGLMSLERGNDRKIIIPPGVNNGRVLFLPDADAKSRPWEPVTILLWLYRLEKDLNIEIKQGGMR